MDYASQRVKMVDSQIRTTDVTSHSVLNAFLAVERERFVADRLKSVAYIDNDAEIAPGRFLMAPSPLAKLLQLAEIRKTDHVLEIGTGTGYVAALLSRIAGSVVALESDAGLAEVARANLGDCTNVDVVTGPLEAGCPSRALYDVIFVSGAVEQLPSSLFADLKDGGRLVAVLGEGLASGAHIYVREAGAHSDRFAFNASVRRLPGFARAAEFVF